MLPIIKKQNPKISIKISDVEKGLDLKFGELGTDGKNLFIGGIRKNFSVTCPVGTIVFWLPVGFDDSMNGGINDLTSTIKIPVGWKIADGKKVENPNSPYNNYYLPNLSNDIFLQGTTPELAGLSGGTNDASHKHNIAHHHETFNGADNNGGMNGIADHTHSYSDLSFVSGAHALGDNDFATGTGYDREDYTSPTTGSHSHTVNAMNIGNTSSLHVNSSNHPNSGNPTLLDGVTQFNEHRPIYISGIYLVKIK